MKKYISIFVLGVLTVFSCSKSNNPSPPEAASLIFPEENSECTDGVNLNTTQSTIIFSWSAAKNADSYRLRVTNLSNNSTQNFDATTNSQAVTLTKGQPYSWFVTSLSSKLPNESAQSPIWKFYNAGDGIENYAPFPAEILFPTSGALVTANSGALTLQWDGSDIDGDITTYSLYFGTTNPPTTLHSTGSAKTRQVTGLVSGTVYYWNVITNDSQGNTSESGVYQFKVN